MSRTRTPDTRERIRKTKCCKASVACVETDSGLGTECAECGQRNPDTEFVTVDIAQAAHDGLRL